MVANLWMYRRTDQVSYCTRKMECDSVECLAHHWLTQDFCRTPAVLFNVTKCLHEKHPHSLNSHHGFLFTRTGVEAGHFNLRNLYLRWNLAAVDLHCF